jgi:hypothetical protein
MINKKSNFEFEINIKDETLFNQYLEPNIEVLKTSENFKYLVLMDLASYQNENLSTRALSLLFRESTQKEELVEHLKKIELLISDQMIESYNQLSKELIDLRNIFDAKLSQEMINECIKVLDIFLKFDFKENIIRTQRILRNLNFNKIIIQILKRLDL